MAEKLTDRTELIATPADGDFFHVVDVSDLADGSAGTSKKIRRDNMVGGLVAGPASALSDQIAVFDSTTGKLIKIVTVTIDSSGNMVMPAGSVLSTEAIKFPATAVPSADPNTFDDYEKGSWTVVLTDGTNNATQNASDGTYIKTADGVECKFRCRVTSLGSVSGEVKISGFPFVSEIGFTNQSAMCAGFGGGLNIAAGNNISGFMSTASSEMVLTIWDAATGTTNLDALEWSDSGDIIMSMNYVV